MAREQGKKCVVFSIGSNNDFSFEESIVNELPECEVHTFDHTITPKAVPSGVNFHAWGIGTEDVGSVKTLDSIMKALNIGSEHSLEILKIDVEGAGSFRVFHNCFESPYNVLYFWGVGGFPHLQGFRATSDFNFFLIFSL